MYSLFQKYKALSAIYMQYIRVQGHNVLVVQEVQSSLSNLYIFSTIEYRDIMYSLFHKYKALSATYMQYNRVQGHNVLFHETRSCSIVYLEMRTRNKILYINVYRK